MLIGRYAATIGRGQRSGGSRRCLRMASLRDWCRWKVRTSPFREVYRFMMLSLGDQFLTAAAIGRRVKRFKVGAGNFERTAKLGEDDQAPDVLGKVEERQITPCLRGPVL